MYLQPGLAQLDGGDVQDSTPAESPISSNTMGQTTGDVYAKQYGAKATPAPAAPKLDKSSWDKSVKVPQSTIDSIKKGGQAAAAKAYGSADAVTKEGIKRFYPGAVSSEKPSVTPPASSAFPPILRPGAGNGGGVGPASKPTPATSVPPILRPSAGGGVGPATVPGRGRVVASPTPATSHGAAQPTPTASPSATPSPRATSKTKPGAGTVLKPAIPSYKGW